MGRPGWAPSQPPDGGPARGTQAAVPWSFLFLRTGPWVRWGRGGAVSGSSSIGGASYGTLHRIFPWGAPWDVALARPPPPCGRTCRAAGARYPDEDGPSRLASPQAFCQRLSVALVRCARGAGAGGSPRQCAWRGHTRDVPRTDGGRVAA